VSEDKLIIVVLVAAFILGALSAGLVGLGAWSLPLRWPSRRPRSLHSRRYGWAWRWRSIRLTDQLRHASAIVLSGAVTREHAAMPAANGFIEIEIRYSLSVTPHDVSPPSGNRSGGTTENQQWLL
jgi:hypothetical protein